VLWRRLVVAFVSCVLVERARLVVAKTKNKSNNRFYLHLATNTTYQLEFVLMATTLLFLKHLSAYFPNHRDSFPDRIHLQPPPNLRTEHYGNEEITIFCQVL
jgi:hypothetical protein